MSNVKWKGMNNRSYIVLLKKKEDACTPDAYRPYQIGNKSPSTNAT
jgi:hypothetical protein